MASLRPQHYRLLALPYRTAVWHMLARFKTEFVGDFVERFAGQTEGAQREMCEAAAETVGTVSTMYARERRIYQSLLTGTIERLDLSASSDMPAAAIAAEVRCQQIECYLEELAALWRAAAEAPTPHHVFVAFSQSLWPYYCVTYRRSAETAPDGPKYNFVTWLADSSVLKNDCFPASAFPELKSPGAVRRRILRLIPSLDGCFDETGSEHLRRLVDAASLHLLDFERVETNLGHIQRLNDPSEFREDVQIIERMMLPVSDPADRDQVAKGLSQGTAAFTDLFQFINVALRYVISGTMDELPESAPTPLGVLFVATPSLRLIDDLLGACGTGFTGAVTDAWDRTGGVDLARSCHRDFERLRQLIKDVDRSMLAEAAGDIAHHSKNILGTISSHIRLAQDPKRSNEQATLLRLAEHSIKYMGQEYGLRDRIQSVLGAQDDVRALLASLSNDELHDVIRLQFRLLLIVRQGADLDLQRTYSLDREPIQLEEMTIANAELDLRDRLADFYERRGTSHDVAYAADLRYSLDFGVDRDPIALQLFFMLRELVDNMRPRRTEFKGTSVDVTLSRFEQGSEEHWRMMRVTQTLAGFSGSDPFGDVVDSQSLRRYNRRYGKEGARIAHIITNGPIVRHSQHVLTQELLLPAA